MTAAEDDLAVFPDMVGRLRRVGEAFVADTAVVVGDVVLGRDASVWFGAVVRGDDARIEVGAATNLQDLVVVHADPGRPLHIGEGVTVGHGALLHGVSIGDHTLIGMGAILLGGSRIGRCCVVGAGALVLEGVEIPDRSIVLGVPGRVAGVVEEEQAARLEEAARRYVARARSYLGVAR